MNRTQRIFLKFGVLVGIPVIAFAGLLLGAAPDATTQSVNPSATPAAGATTPAVNPTGLKSYDDLLAGRLHVTVDQLRAAEAQARDQYFDQLVGAGILNPSQAAALKASLPGAMFGGALLSALNPAPVKDAILESAANALGMSDAELRSQLDSGKTLNQIAQDHHVDIEQLRSQMDRKAGSLFSQAEALGLLTTDEANNVTDQLQQRIDSLINKTLGTSQSPAATATP